MCSSITYKKGKVKVWCDQTGKVFITSLPKVLDEDCNPLSEDELEIGGTIFWEDEDLDTYPMTVLKVIGESAGKDHFVLVIFCVVLHM